MSQISALVVGAGLGGLATAIHLARHGIHVTVLEKNTHAGGRVDRFSRQGHCFDTGPTLLIMPHVFEAEFAALGTPFHDLLDLERVDPTYRLVFDDGQSLTLTSDLKDMHDQLEALEPGAFRGFLRYLDEGYRHYNQAMTALVNRDFRTASEFFNLRNLPLLFTLKPLVPHYAHMATYFRTARLKAAFTFQDVYMGLSPFEAPATFSMMPFTEIAHGVWYPRGGMYQIVETLLEMARQAGVEFAFSTRVEQIEVQGQQTSGVRLRDGLHIKADLVVANADLPYVYTHLLPPDSHAMRVRRKRYSCSVISFFWGLDRVYPALGPHTLFLADDYRENFASIVKRLDLPANPSLYLHAPGRLDPGMAPPGEDTLIAIVPVGHINEHNPQDWAALIHQARRAVFRRLSLLGITDLEAHIKFETVFAPPSWLKRYNLSKGATHGLCHNLTQLGYLRPGNRHPHYTNLYFTGASTHPGTGMPTALVSARHTATRICEAWGLTP